MGLRGREEAVPQKVGGTFIYYRAYYAIALAV